MMCKTLLARGEMKKVIKFHLFQNSITIAICERVKDYLRFINEFISIRVLDRDTRYGMLIGTSHKMLWFSTVFPQDVSPCGGDIFKEDARWGKV